MKIDNLYRLRTQNKRYISQRELSKLSGYSQTYISLIETNKLRPSHRCTKTILNVLGMLKKSA